MAKPEPSSCKNSPLNFIQKRTCKNTATLHSFWFKLCENYIWGQQITQNSSSKFVHAQPTWKEGKQWICRGRRGSNLGTGNRKVLEPAPHFLTSGFWLCPLLPTPTWGHGKPYSKTFSLHLSWSSAVPDPGSGQIYSSGHRKIRACRYLIAWSRERLDTAWEPVLDDTKQATHQQLLLATCVCSSRRHRQEGTLCWVTASTKPVTLQMVQPWQLQEWELHLVFLLLCKLRPQSIHPSLSTKSSAAVWCNLSTSYIHTSLSWSWKTPFKNYQWPCITKQRLSNSSSSFQ